MESRVDLVTLSDSLTSPLPKPKPKARAAVKGTPKVVCLDSDTESDASYTQTRINPFCYGTSNAANSGVASNASEKANNRRLGLRKCSDDRKPFSSIPLTLENKCPNDQKPWTQALSLSFKKEIEGDLIENKAMDQPKSCCDAGILEAGFDADAKCKQDAEIKLLFHSNDLCSPQNVSSFGFKDKLHIDHKPLLHSKGIADIGLHSSYSPSASLEQGIYIGSFGSHRTSMLSASPCREVQNAIYVESKPSSDDKGTDALKTYGLCSSLRSNESDGYLSMPAWNDHLKGIISKLETSKSTDVCAGISQEQPFKHRINAENSDDDMDSGGYSAWKRKFYEPGRHDVGDTELSDSGDNISCRRQKKSGKGQSGRAGSGVAARTAGAGGCSFWKRKIYERGGHNVGNGESSDSGDSLSCKRQKKSGKGRSGSGGSGVDVRTTARTAGDSTKALEKAAEKQKKVEKRLKDKEEKEAKMKHLKEERENLRREKQEEKKRQQEVRKMRNKEEKNRKEELKAEAVERRKVEKEKGKWEKGKFALQNITAFVDTQILEGGLIGGHLLTRFAEKGFNYRLVKNPVKKTVIWQMKLPSKESIPNPQADSQSQDSQELNALNQSGPELLLESIAVSYVLVVLEAEEFLDMITRDDLDNHIRNLQEQYPGFTLCYLINKLMWYLNKREQQQYKNPANNWIRPPVEQVLAKLVTSYNRVHSRLCLDEAEVSDHIMGLTRSLAECPFKRKLTPLSLSANGDHVVKNDPNSDIIKKDVWLKALVALPKISGSCAIAIAKKYPSMSAIFEAYLDPSKTVHEKEYLLQDLMKEGLFGGDSNRRVGPACSRRVYRILMAQQGNLHTDDVEEGADLFID